MVRLEVPPLAPVAAADPGMLAPIGPVTVPRVVMVLETSESTDLVTPPAVVDALMRKV